MQCYLYQSFCLLSLFPDLRSSTCSVDTVCPKPQLLHAPQSPWEPTTAGPVQKIDIHANFNHTSSDTARVFVTSLSLSHTQKKKTSFFSSSFLPYFSFSQLASFTLSLFFLVLFGLLLLLFPLFVLWLFLFYLPFRFFSSRLSSSIFFSEVSRARFSYDLLPSNVAVVTVCVIMHWNEDSHSRKQHSLSSQTYASGQQQLETSNVFAVGTDQQQESLSFVQSSSSSSGNLVVSSSSSLSQPRTSLV